MRDLRVHPPVLHVARLIAGESHRLPLVLLHGFTGDGTTWAPLTDCLERDRDVFAVDLVGHGQSEAPADPEAYTMPVAVAAVRAAVARAVGADTAVHCLGYSMGGRVALHLALDASPTVASVTLVGTSPGIADPVARAERIRADDALAARLERDGLEAFVEAWMAMPLFATQARLGADALASARAQRLRNRPHALACTLRGMGTGAIAPVWHRLGEIAVPVLLVSGELDPKFSDLAAATAAGLRRAERLVVAGAGHAVHVESPGVLAAALRAFLLGVERE